MQLEVLITPNRTDLGQVKGFRLSLEDWAYATKVAPIGYGGCTRSSVAVFVEALKRHGDARLGSLVAYVEAYCRFGFNYNRVAKSNLAEPTEPPKAERPTKRDPLADVDLSQFAVDHAAVTPRPPAEKPELRTYTGHRRAR
jgi:hypothetical protein